jgi:transcriptional regulator with XRE-family HTH domain
MKRYIRLRGMSISDLAAEAGLSRQAVYQMMKSGYRPVSSGLESVARVLDLDAVDLLCKTDKTQDRIEAVVGTVEAAAAGDPRAFETLPACILDLGSRNLTGLNDLSRPIPQLLAAAGQVALHLAGLRWLERFISRQSAWTPPELAFFFGSELMDTARIVRLTPEPMAAHRVFGVFDMDAFARHAR